MVSMKLLALVWNLNINSLQILVICFVLGVRFTKVSVEEKRPQQTEYEDEPVIISFLAKRFSRDGNLSGEWSTHH